MKDNIRVKAAHEIARSRIFHPIGKKLTDAELAALNESDSIEVVEHRSSGPGFWRDEYRALIVVTNNGSSRNYLASIEEAT